MLLRDPVSMPCCCGILSVSHVVVVSQQHVMLLWDPVSTCHVVVGSYQHVILLWDPCNQVVVLSWNLGSIDCCHEILSTQYAHNQFKL